MGRTGHERQLRFDYFPEFIEHWNNQSDDFKELCENYGKKVGYTGINVFYVFIWQYWTHKLSDIDRKSWIKNI